MALTSTPANSVLYSADTQSFFSQAGVRHWVVARAAMWISYMQGIHRLKVDLQGNQVNWIPLTRRPYWTPVHLVCSGAAYSPLIVYVRMMVYTLWGSCQCSHKHSLEMTLFEGILALFIRQYNESALTLNSVYTLMYLLPYQETDVLPTRNEESQSALEMLQINVLSITIIANVSLRWLLMLSHHVDSSRNHMRVLLL